MESNNQFQELQSILGEDLKFNNGQIDQVLKYIKEEINKAKDTNGFRINSIRKENDNLRMSYNKRSKPTIQKRVDIINKILMSEEVYISILRDLMNDFLIPLEQLYADDKKIRPFEFKKPITKEDVTLLFLNVRELYEFHSTLLKELIYFSNNGERDCPIGPLFLVFEPSFSMYKQYVGNYYQSMKRMNWLMKDKKFNQNIMGKVDKCNFGRLYPINRISHYQTYLEALKNVTPIEDRDYSYLERVLEKFQKLKVIINNAQPLFSLMQLQSTIESCPVKLYLNKKNKDLIIKLLPIIV